MSFRYIYIYEGYILTMSLSQQVQPKVQVLLSMEPEDRDELVRQAAICNVPRNRYITEFLRQVKTDSMGRPLWWQERKEEAGVGTLFDVDRS